MSHATSNAVETMDLEFGGDPDYQHVRAQKRIKSQAAQAIYEGRVAAGRRRL